MRSALIALLPAFKPRLASTSVAAAKVMIPLRKCESTTECFRIARLAGQSQAPSSACKGDFSQFVVLAFFSRRRSAEISVGSICFGKSSMWTVVSLTSGSLLSRKRQRHGSVSHWLRPFPAGARRWHLASRGSAIQPP